MGKSCRKSALSARCAEENWFEGLGDTETSLVAPIIKQINVDTAGIYGGQNLSSINIAKKPGTTWWLFQASCITKRILSFSSAYYSALLSLSMVSRIARFRKAERDSPFFSA